MKTRIIVADDHALLRDNLTAAINRETDLEVIGQAADGLEALALVEALRPDLVLLDINMPNLNGLEAAREITRQFPEIKIVALTMFTDKRYVLGMLQAGARAYFCKSSPYEELTSVIRTVLQGGVYLSPKVTEVVVKEAIKPEPDLLSLLSAREKEVLGLTVEGKTAREIAKILYISRRTVEANRLNIMRKLNLRNLAETVKFGLRAGLGEAEKQNAR